MTRPLDVIVGLVIPYVRWVMVGPVCQKEIFVLTPASHALPDESSRPESLVAQQKRRCL